MDFWRNELNVSERFLATGFDIFLRRHLDAALADFRAKFENSRTMRKKKFGHFIMDIRFRERLSFALGRRFDYHFLAPYFVNGEVVFFATRPYWEDPGWAVIAVDRDLQPKIICEFRIAPKNR